MQYDGVLVRYGELGIKSPPVRRRMTDKLRQNLLDGLLRAGVEGDVRASGARLWMAGPDVDGLLRVASRTFGVVSASPTITCAPTMEALKETAARLALDSGDWTSFAVRARREGDHAFTSMDLGRDVGSAVFVAAEAAGRTPKVDLTAPDLELHLDVRAKTSHLFTRSVEGPGGLPAGAQGQVVCLLDRPDSVVAAWLMMRRGCNLILAHPTDAAAPETVAALQPWGAPRESHPLTGDDPVDAAWQGFRVDAVVTADTLADDLTLREGLPVLRPLAGLAHAEVERIRRLIHGAA